MNISFAFLVTLRLSKNGFNSHGEKIYSLFHRILLGNSLFHYNSSLTHWKKKKYEKMIKVCIISYWEFIEPLSHICTYFNCFSFFFFIVVMLKFLSENISILKWIYWECVAYTKELLNTRVYCRIFVDIIIIAILERKFYLEKRLSRCNFLFSYSLKCNISSNHHA